MRTRWHREAQADCGGGLSLQPRAAGLGAGEEDRADEQVPSPPVVVVPVGARQENSDSG